MRLITSLIVLCSLLLGGAAAGAQTSEFGTPGLGGIQTQFDWLTLQAMDIESRAKKEKQQQQQMKLVSQGLMSALDMKAPIKAANEFNKGVTAMKKDDAKTAIEAFKKALQMYPDFVSAHDSLGTAYSSVGRQDEARKEYETAIGLDDKFAGSYFNLGRVAMMERDYEAAVKAMEKGAALQPNGNTLTALAYAQFGNQDFAAAIQTCERVHGMEHKPNAAVHYVAAASYIALHKYDDAEDEFKLLLAEDSVNPLAPVAQQDIALIERHKEQAEKQVAATAAQSARMQAALNSIKDPSAGCYDCANGSADSARTGVPGNPIAPEASGDVTRDAGGFVMRKTVDEVALFFSALEGSHPVTDLKFNNIQVRDNNEKPEKIITFQPQSKLPLRLALIVDTSGSVEKRLDFEKQAAIKFMRSMLTGPKDLAFVVGFANRPEVTQDFTANQEKLAKGINALTDHGGTALWDAISYASWKLAQYPDRGYVARVIVVVSDGEDNSSRLTLRRALEDADRAAVSIYTVSSRDVTNMSVRWSERNRPTDGDRILQAIADRTGGEAMFPGAVQNLGGSFTRLHDIIRNRYLVAYKPAAFHPDGSYRKVAVDARQDGKRLKVRVRDGYYARPY